MRVNVRRSPPRRAEGIKLLRLRVAPSAVQTLIKYTIPVSGLDGLVEEKKEDGGQKKERDTGKRAGRPCLTRWRKRGRMDGQREEKEGGEGGLILKKYTHTHEKRHS